MKIIFVQPKKSTQELEIEPIISAQECKKILIDQYKWPNGDYKFIFNGKILNASAPFEKIKPGSNVIVYIKEIIKKENTLPPQVSQANPSSQHVESPQSSQSSQSSQSPQSGANSRRANRIILQNDEIRALLQNHLQACNVEQLYNPNNNILQHPEALANIEEILTNNPGVFSIIENEILRNHSAAARFGGTQIDTVSAFMGVSLPPLPTASYYDVQLQCMSDAQRASFQRLLELGQDKNITLDTYIACEYNEEQTRICLSQMNE